MQNNHDNKTRTSEDFLLFLRTILRPAAEEFEARLFSKNIKLHHVFQINMIAAHMIDYIVAIRRADGCIKGRKELVKSFDDVYAVEGALFLNRKFQLVDAVNNALKHINLDANRYSDLFSQYGDIKFHCLREHDGLVVFEVGKHRFDFARVVLRPVLQVVVPWEFDEIDDVVDFARGEYANVEVFDVSDGDPDPVEQMIDYCNPTCLDCGEGGDDCRCSEFIYDGQSGEFRCEWDESFDFDAVMSRISGAYRPAD